jgi:peroxiredoxin Q/BCP
VRQAASVDREEWDDTSGCTKEACDFRDGFAAYKKTGARILGVSPEPVKSHAKFAGKYELPFTLLADVDEEVSQAYGVWKEKSMYGRKYMGIEHTTFVIAPEGIVWKVFPKVKATGHSDAVLEAVEALRS